ncbi:Hydroxyacid oxidase 1 [Smittium mucronatum]|uniref:Oxidase FUB9 n=1 Tax=Smittium mucronatum TaxID=133383 RepID=A0A1R0H3F3_9FUNG|nr:Hydroxyacid oxidase 1 [Smittium mucronatum]
MQRISCLADLEREAVDKLDLNTRTFFQSGAMDLLTRDDNREAYNRIRIIPRMLRDVSKIDTSLSIFGQTFKSPVFLAASANQRMAHTDGEIAASRSACKHGVLHVLSSISNYSIEEVSKGVADLTESGENTSVRWLQLYVFQDRHISYDLVKRAEQAGYTGIVVTVDTPYAGRRLDNIRSTFRVPQHLSLGNFEKYADGMHTHSPTAESTRLAHQNVNYTNYQIDPSLNWNDIKEIKKLTKLPVLLKGILTHEDAAIAVDVGVDGIIVSNHGGRQLDTVPATIVALPEVVDAVKKRIPVFVDGGILRGTDVFKALAVGADAVFVGRPVLWGLTYDGEKGVDLMIDLINEELRLAMALSGCIKISDINRSYLLKSDLYPSKL